MGKKIKTMDFKVAFNFTPDYQPDCYLQYVSPFTSCPLGNLKVQNEELETGKVDGFVSQLVKKIKSSHNPVLFLNMPQGATLIYGERGGLAINFGLDDYQKYTKAYQQVGDYTFQYKSGPNTFLCLLNRHVKEMLINLTIRQYRHIYQKDPENIYLKVTSKSEETTQMSQVKPDDPVKYQLLENPVYTGKYMDKM